MIIKAGGRSALELLPESYKQLLSKCLPLQQLCHIWDSWTVSRVLDKCPCWTKKCTGAGGLTDRFVRFERIFKHGGLEDKTYVQPLKDLIRDCRPCRRINLW